MKKVKFKVWNKINHRMYKPLGITFDTQSLSPFAVSVPGKSWEPVEKFEILQWTGFCDDNGVDVFEGDLIKISSVLYKVKWNEADTGFELWDVFDHSATRNIKDAAKGDVVGNIYENADIIMEKRA